MSGGTSRRISDQSLFDSVSHLPNLPKRDMASTCLEQFKTISDGWRSFQSRKPTGTLLASEFRRTGTTLTQRQAPNGSLVEIRSNGMEIHLYIEDRLAIYWPDGRTSAVEPTYSDRGIRRTRVDDEGNVSFAYVDGTRETKYQCGFQTIEFPDGSGYLREDNGTTHLWHATGGSEHYDERGQLKHSWTVEPDGTRVCTDGCGHVEMTQCTGGRICRFGYGPNGKLAEIDAHLGVWKRDKDCDGKDVWVNQSTGKVWSGNFSVDSHGSARYMPHKSNVRCSAEVLAFPSSGGLR